MGFGQGLSGLNASSKALDIVGNNISNSGTIGFKAGQAQFGDVFAASLNGSGAAPVGLGSKVAAVVQNFTQGNISVTNNPLDVAINGGGFFVMDDGSGGDLFGRNGQFQLDKDGYIVNANGLQLKGRMAVNGVIPDGAVLESLRLFDPSQSLTGPPQATGTSSAASGVQANVNLDSREAAFPAFPGAPVFNYQNPSTYNTSTSTTVYDSLGNPHTYSMYFRKTGTAAWDVYATVTNPAGATTTFTDLSAAGTARVGTLTFDTDGTLLSGIAAPQAITAAQLGYAGGVDNLSFAVNFSGSTQYGSDFTVNTLLQDGYASGTLAGFNIGSDGVVLGRYTNGQSKNVGQIVLATFRNPQGLQPLGDNVWARTPQSGDAITGTPKSSGQYGALQSAAVEDASVDLTAELVNMITLQRAYQANAQTIRTQDQILQTLVNLR